MDGTDRGRGVEPESLRRMETTLRLAGDLARLGGWRVDLVANRVHWTDQVADIHETERGFSPTVEEGISFYAPECRARIAEVFAACARDGIPYDEELRIITAKGREVWVRTIGVPVRDAAGRIVEVAGAFQDISERRAAEAREAALREQLMQAWKLESIGRLAGGVAHDFNNMLNVILGRAEIALERLPEGDPTRADLLEIHSAARHSADVTRQLLGFARRQPVVPRPLDLVETVGASIRMLRRLVGERIELVFIPEAGVPRVLADPSQIEQVLANLCVNAADAIDGTGRIEVRTAPVTLDAEACAKRADAVAGTYALLAVRDNGGGMDEVTRACAFEPFFTTKGAGKGTGLGLATVYGIARQNGGFAEIESAPGRGSEIRVFFPALVEAEGSVVSEEGEPSCPRANPGETVLVVEDEPGVRLLCEMMLHGLGYRSISCASPLEALALDSTARIDLLVTDVVMPSMNGRRVAEELRRLRPALRVLYMSGYNPEEIERNLGSAVECLRKPFTKRAFASALRRALDTP